MSAKYIEDWLCEKWLGLSSFTRFIHALLISTALSILVEKTHAILEKSSGTVSPQRTDWFVVAIVLTASMVFSLMLTRRELDREKLLEANKELKRISSYDSLTGLHSRYYFDESLPRIEAEAKRHNWYAWAIMADLDKFKAINDNLGHEAGDDVLRFVSKKFKGLIRESDNCCRIGGDEIAIVGNDQSPEAVRSLILRIIADMEGWYVEIKGVEIKVKVSIGYSVKKIADGETLASIIAEADKFMYMHKRGELN
jgi:diguanylate cyclase (GGDEF)-like protein